MSGSSIEGLENLANVQVVGKKKRQDPIDEIWIHMNPDIDEIIAAWLVMEHGGHRFSGSSCALVKMIDPNAIKEDYYTLLGRKILSFGFGGGPFDEHPEAGDDGKRIRDHSAASLVASALGVRNK